MGWNVYEVVEIRQRTTGKEGSVGVSSGCDRWRADGKGQPSQKGVVSCAVMYGNTDSSVVLSQDMDGPARPDGFADCPSCSMLAWSHSQQVGDLIGVFSEARPLVGTYSGMAVVSTCAAKDWRSALQHSDLVNLFLQVGAEARSIHAYASRPIQVDES